MRRPASPPSAAETSAPVRVERIGADGDGIAVGPGGKTLFLANTLPGEWVQPGPLTRRGDALAGDAAVIEASPDRVEPPCPHFGPCGGCTLQHWQDAAYAEWKRLRAEGAAGLPIATLSRTPPGARRRMDLAVRRESAAVRIGLHRRRSAELVDMRECPILAPALFELVQALRPVLLRLDGLRREGEAQVNLLDSGPDLLLRTDAPLSARDRVALAGLATERRMPRVYWARMGDRTLEPAAVIGPTSHAFSGRTTEPPPGAFLQASRQGEAAIVAAVLAALPEKLKGSIVELYAGSGSLTHALSDRAPVAAFEGDAAAVAALRAARNPRVTATLRDLARQPLREAELKGVAAVVLDPPYAGAAAQMPALVAARLPIIYVSCNPVALIRDTRLLLDAGYQPVSAAAIDQFLWSTQVETVVGFAVPTRSRDPRSRRDARPA